MTTYMLINLFILVLLQQYETYHNDPDNPLNTFKDYLLKFRNIWALFSAKYEGKRIHVRSLTKFFKKLSPPLGFEDFEDIDIILKEIMEMKLIV